MALARDVARCTGSTYDPANFLGYVGLITVDVGCVSAWLASADGRGRAGASAPLLRLCCPADSQVGPVRVL